MKAKLLLLFFVSFLIFIKIEAQVCGIGAAEAIYGDLFDDDDDDSNLRSADRIIGGHPVVNDAAFPWIVWIVIKDSKTGKVTYCTGSIVGSRWILTGKHCTTFYDKFLVHYGSTNQSEMIQQYGPQKFEPEGPKIYGEDIALIKLKEPIEFNANVGPICLSRKYRPKVGDKIIAAGFGSVFIQVNENVTAGDPIPTPEFPGLPVLEIFFPEELFAAPIPIIDNVNCNCKCVFCNCTDPENAIHGIVEDFEFCGGGVMAGTMGGDSGGPQMIMEKDSKIWYQVGVTSRGRQFSSGDPRSVIDRGIYTDVAKFCDWIEETTEKEVMCSG